MNSSNALKEYRSVGVQTGITDASAHKVVAMLMAGALEHIAVARGAVERDNMALKGESVSRVIAIVDTLRASLNYEQGGEIAVNLGSLYDYMEKRLLQANINNDVSILDEVAALLQEIKLGWDAIPEDMRGGHRGA